jgi:hypothetical protein
VARRKAAVVAAVRQGVITREEACRRYELSEEQLSSWQRSFEAYGVNGLRVTQLRQYRDDSSSRLPLLRRRLRLPRGKIRARRSRNLLQTPVPNFRVSERI